MSIMTNFNQKEESTMTGNRIRQAAMLAAVLLFCLLPCAQAGRTIYGGQEKAVPGVLYPYNAPEGSCLIDLSGNVYADDGYYSIYALLSDSGERLFSAAKIEGDNMRFYLLDEKGRRLTDSPCFWLAPSGEYFVFQSANDLCGLYNWNGETLVEPVYQTLIPTGEGSYIGLADDRWAIQSAEADLIRPGLPVEKIRLGDGDVTGLEDFNGGLAAAYTYNGERSLTGFVDVTGRWRIPPTFDYTNGFNGDYAVVSMGGSVGLIDREGNTALPFEYDTINPVEGGQKKVLAAQRGTDVTIFNAETLEPLFQVGDADYGWIEQGAALVVRGASVSQTRVYNLEGKLIRIVKGDNKYVTIINDNRYYVSDYSDYSFKVCDFQGNAIMSGVGLVDFVTGADGACALEVWVSDIIDYGEGNTGLDWDRMRCGLYDLDGNELLEPKYDYIAQVCEGYYSAQRGQWHGIIDSNGDWILKRSNYSSLMD